MRESITVASATLVLLLALAGCGGGGGASPNSTPLPPPAPSPAPAPTPTPTPAQVIKPETLTIGTNAQTVAYTVYETDTLSSESNVSGSKDLAKFIKSVPSEQGATIELDFDEARQIYKIKLPTGEAGELTDLGLNGSVGQIASSTFHRISSNGEIVGSVWMPVPFRERYPYTYSHYGRWYKSEGNADGTYTKIYGWFVYGYQPAADAIPRSGTATYRAEIFGETPVDAFEISGTVRLAFDFGFGTLSGSMNPFLYTNGWYTDLDYDYGVYDFAQTVYSVGSANYSGKFSKDGVLLDASWFDGSLTGPNAQEVIGRFSAPFTRDGTQGTMTGVWIGKKD